MLYHPDKNKLSEAEEMFKGIAEALLKNKQDKMWQIIREQKQREARLNQILWEFNLYQEQDNISKLIIIFILIENEV